MTAEGGVLHRNARNGSIQLKLVPASKRTGSDRKQRVHRVTMPPTLTTTQFIAVAARKIQSFAVEKEITWILATLRWGKWGRAN